MSKRHTFIKIILPILIVVVAGLTTIIMIKQKPAPAKQDRVVRGIPVQVITTQKKDLPIPIRGTGEVAISSEINLMAEVGARVVEISPAFTKGGFVHKGELIFSLEKTDFELSLKKTKAAIEKIQLEIIQLENQSAVALNQWQQNNPTRKPHPLIVFKPQLKNARAQLAAAKASHRQAEINLQRTRVYASFSGLVTTKNLALGQLVKPGATVGRIIDSSLAEINVPLPPESLTWLHIPGQNQEIAGSKAKITMDLGDQRVDWQGELVRSFGTIDPQTRMATVVVQVKDPYGLEASRPFPLMNGAFVQVEFLGINLNDVIEIPRAALRADNTVWTVDTDDRLVITPVTIARKLYDRVLISKGLEADNRVIVSALSRISTGMILRPIQVEN